MKFEIIDNLVPIELSNQIEKTFLTDLPWYHFDDVTYANEKIDSVDFEKSPGFNHEFFDYKTGLNSNFFTLVENIPHLIFKNFEFLKVRAFFQLPTIGEKIHNNPHKDFQFPHTVLLYYVNDSDGDTFFFDDDEKIMAKVSPKKGRILVFDGRTLHASSQPKKNKRIIINYGIKND
jgi:hypothetical protein